jgi:hypothetical protein
MTERQWELYRLSVVEMRLGSPFRAVTIAGIQNMLAAIADAEAPGTRMSGDWKRVKRAA